MRMNEAKEPDTFEELQTSSEISDYACRGDYLLEGWNKGHRAGQRAMRERAAKLFENESGVSDEVGHAAQGIANVIRSLEIQDPPTSASPKKEES